MNAWRKCGGLCLVVTELDGWLRWPKGFMGTMLSKLEDLGFSVGALSKGVSQDFLDLVLERNTTADIGKGSPSGERDLKNHQLNNSLDQVSSPVRRELVSRASFGMRTPGNNDEIDVESGRTEKDREKTVRSKRGISLHNQALLSGLAYCFSSCSMILVNKYVLSSYDFNAGISLMLYQNFVSVIIVSLLSFLGLITTEPFTWRLIKVWLPVNVIFVGMLITSMFSLKYINVAMVTVLKNVTNVLTAVGEMYLFNKHHDNRVWAALFLMIISAISGGITDLSFHAIGYTWQFMNCCLTASYSLTLRRIMDTAKQVTKSGELNEFSMVLLNNCLSLPLGIFLIFVFNEVDYLLHTPLLRLPTFWLVITFSGFLGLAISFTSLWFLHQTGATTYSLIGSLNKIPLSVAGILLFKVPTSLENSASIFFGLVAGVFFARAKMR
ncbi:GDP-mannose transporter GONST1-like isoform X1 [Henckelia pumila]|uniref:GDP-mannose transporter GONST1-like isoform X1 n=2 Tax=Henckelia pumila TaxID=405737 RepID=UPI003C6E8E53